MCERANHILHVYDSDEDRTLPIREILRSQGDNDTLFYLTDNPNPVHPAPISDEYEGLVKDSIDSGQLRINPARSYYHFDESFDVTSTLKRCSKLFRELNDGGFERMVLIGDVGGSTSIPKSVEAFMEYEALLNLFDLPENITIVCQYEKNLFEDRHLRRAFALHELLARDGQFIRNYWISSNGLNCGQPVFNI